MIKKSTHIWLVSGQIQRSGSTLEADGPDFEANLELLGNAGGEDGDEGEKDGDVDEEDKEVESGAAGASTGSEPDSGPDSAEK